MVFENEVDGWQISQRLVRSHEVVFDEPLSQIPVEQCGICCHVAKAQKLILEGSVEPFVHGIVLGRLGAGPVVLKMKRGTGFVEMPMELAAIVSLDVLDFSVKQEM